MATDTVPVARDDLRLLVIAAGVLMASLDRYDDPEAAFTDADGHVLDELYDAGVLDEDDAGLITGSGRLRDAFGRLQALVAIDADSPPRDPPSPAVAAILDRALAASALPGSEI